MRTIYLWQLASWELAGFEIYFSNTCPTAFPEGSWQFTEPQPLGIEVSACTGDQVVVTENVHMVAAVFIPNSGSGGNQNLRKSWLPRLWTGVECAWANSQRFVSHYLFPLKLHPFPPDSSQPGPQHPAALSRRRLKLGTPAPGELKARWHFQGSRGQTVVTTSFGCTRTMVPVRANQKV